MATQASRSAIVRGRRRSRSVVSTSCGMHRIRRSGRASMACADASPRLVGAARLHERDCPIPQPLITVHAPAAANNRGVAGRLDPCHDGRGGSCGGEVRLSLAQTMSPDDAARLIPDGAVVAISSSSGLNTPDRVLQAIGERFAREGRPRALTTVHPIGTGDMYGITGIDHLARPGLLKRRDRRQLSERPVVAADAGDLAADPRRRDRGVQPAERPDLRHAAQRRGWHRGCAHPGRPRHLRRSAPRGRQDEPRARARTSCAWSSSTAPNGCTLARCAPDVAIVRGTSADARGNVSMEHEAAPLGTLDLALAARNAGGLVIAQVKRLEDGGRAADARGPRALLAGRRGGGRPGPGAGDGDPVRPGAVRRGQGRSRRARGRAVRHREGDRPTRGDGARRRRRRGARLRRLGPGAAHPARGRAARPGHLGDRAGPGRRRAGHRASRSAARSTPMPSSRRRSSSRSSRAPGSTARSCRSCRSTATATSMSRSWPSGPI